MRLCAEDLQVRSHHPVRPTASIEAEQHGWHDTETLDTYETTGPDCRRIQQPGTGLRDFAAADRCEFDLV